MVWWWGEGKTYFEVSARAHLGEVSCWVDTPPKRAKLSWSHKVRAMRDREREGTHTITGKGCHDRLTNKIVLFVW